MTEVPFPDKWQCLWWGVQKSEAHVAVKTKLQDTLPLNEVVGMPGRNLHAHSLSQHLLPLHKDILSLKT